MARLERALGSRLLERTTRSLRLTEASQLAFQHSSGHAGVGPGGAG